MELNDEIIYNINSYKLQNWDDIYLIDEKKLVVKNKEFLSEAVIDSLFVKNLDQSFNEEEFLAFNEEELLKFMINLFLASRKLEKRLFTRIMREKDYEIKSLIAEAEYKFLAESVSEFININYNFENLNYKYISNIINGLVLFVYDPISNILFIIIKDELFDFVKAKASLNRLFN